MGKLLRGLVYLIGILVLLIVIAAVALPFVVDPNDFKDDITRVVEEKTGRQLNIKGDLGLSVFPWLALEIGETSLSNAPGFGADTFAAVKDVQLRVKLLPLLRKEVEMDRVVLNGLELNLEMNRAGVSNWDDLVAGTESEAAQPAEETTSATPLAALAIGGIDISDARVVWDDRSSGVKYTIAPFSLKTGAITPGKPVKLDMDTHIEGGVPSMQGDIAFNGEVDLSESMQQVQLKDIVLDVDVTGEGLPGGKLKTTLKTAASLDLEAQTLSTSQLSLAALGVNLTGNLAGQQILQDGRVITGTFQLQPFSPKTVLKSLGQAAPETSDPSVLGKADASWSIKLESDRLALSDFLLHLDDTTAQGRLSVAHFAKPAVRFDLALDSIDVDRYLPPAAETVPATPTTAAAAGAGALPVDSLRELNLEGALKIGSLKAYQLNSRDIVMKVVARGGTLRVHPASAKMYEGSYSGDVQLDVRGRQPRLSMNERISGVNVGPLLVDMTGKDTLTGITDATVQLAGSGDTPDQIKQTLNGTMSFTFSKGAVKGIDLIRMIRKAKAVLKGKPVPEQSGPEQTDFSILSATATVSNGVIRNDDLSAKSPLLRVEGKGSVDLPKESIDYLLTTTLVGSLEGEGGRELADLKGIPIPVEIKGSFAKPGFRLRLDEAIKRAAGEKIKEKVEEKKQELQEKVEKKVQDKLQKKLGDELGDQLKGLFR